jgi:hypothetical protein
LFYSKAPARPVAEVPSINENGEMSIDSLNAALASISAFVDEQSQFWSSTVVPGELFHYTSAEGLIGIVTSRSLWASDMLSLNDASEANYAFALLSEILDTYHSDVSDHDRHRFKTQLIEYTFRLYTPFITCFCENGDLLSQWRAYGGAGEGFALEFRFSWLSSLESAGFRLQRVIYEPAQQEELILMFLQRVSSLLSEQHFCEEDQTKIWRGAAASLAPWIVMFKDPSFSNEQEWRIVNVSMMKATCFRRSGHRIVPFVTVPINDTEAVSGVIRGPYFAGTDERGVYYMLVSRGFVTGAKVSDSKIPLRR